MTKPLNGESSAEEVVKALPPQLVTRLAALDGAPDPVIALALGGSRAGSWKALVRFAVIDVPSDDAEVVGSRVPPVITARTHEMLSAAARQERELGKALSDEERQEADNEILGLLREEGGGSSSAAHSQGIVARLAARLH